MLPDSKTAAKHNFMVSMVSSVRFLLVLLCIAPKGRSWSQQGSKLPVFMTSDLEHGRTCGSVGQQHCHAVVEQPQHIDGVQPLGQRQQCQRPRWHDLKQSAELMSALRSPRMEHGSLTSLQTIVTRPPWNGNDERSGGQYGKQD